MRVLFWSETYWPRVGGVETLAVQLLSALRARGWAFEVVTWGDAPCYEVARHDGIPVHRFPFFQQRGRQGVEATLELVAQVARLKRAFTPDLVHLNSYGRSTWFHIATAAGRTHPTLLSLHQALPDGAFAEDTLANKVLRSADAITCCSRAVCDATARGTPWIAPRIRVVSNAVPASALAPAASSQEPPTIVFVGRLVPEKGLDWALPALTGVLHERKGARLLVVGDGPQRCDLEHLAAELGLLSSVEFLGPVSPEAVPQILQQATMVVIPSRSEGFGLVALEAALMGRPAVATRVGGLPEVVRHPDTGLLVPPGDGEGLAAAVHFLLEHPAEACRIGRAARERAIAEFRWDRYVDAFDELYRQLATPTQAAHERSLQRVSG